LIDGHAEHLATVPWELGNVFAKLGTVTLVVPVWARLAAD
jgi:hypothetical protein